ncbi:MAG: DUF6776 family protein [Rhodanobacter sp.]
MDLRPPPRFVVRRHDAVGQRRHLIWLGVVWLASLLLVAGLAVWLGGRASGSDTQTARAARTQVVALQQQVGSLQRAAQVDAVATRSLRGTIAQRDEEISALRADLGFYTRLVGGDTQRQGLRLQEVRLRPITGSRGWNLSLSLTQNVRRDDATVGSATVSVEGLRGNKVTRLDWAELGDTENANGLQFHFRYFQQLHGTIVLPADFRPTRVRIRLEPTGGEAFTRIVSWADALSGHHLPTSGESDVPS